MRSRSCCPFPRDLGHVPASSCGSSPCCRPAPGSPRLRLPGQVMLVRASPLPQLGADCTRSIPAPWLWGRCHNTRIHLHTHTHTHARARARACARAHTHTHTTHYTHTTHTLSLSLVKMQLSYWTPMGLLGFRVQY